MCTGAFVVYLVSRCAADGLRDSLSPALTDIFQHIRESLNDFFGKALANRSQCFTIVQAARLQIEHLLFVQRADGRTVAALHIVGDDLKLGNCISMRAGVEHQVAARLISIGLLRVLRNGDDTLIDRMGFTGEQRLEQEIRETVRRVVMLMRAVFGAGFPKACKQAAQVALGVDAERSMRSFETCHAPPVVKQHQFR